jgi:uncharacterized protein (DUF1684 family)
LIGVALLAIRCSAEPIVEMVHIPPRDGYLERVAEFRTRRDAYFARNPGSPLLADERATFSGLEYYDPDPSLYFVGDLQVYIEPEEMQMVTTSGKIRPAEKVGFVAFSIDGKPYRLQVYRLTDGSAGLFLPFADLTTGTETYGAGRYVDLVASSDAGPYELDFNLAYNPSCAYGAAERFVCPVTPTENRLDVRIAAGERGRADVHVEDGG